MRDVQNGWLIRYLHSNTASGFFFLVYLHIGRGLYYGSYQNPRTLVWGIGTVIFILMIATAFLGYVLPFGQMSLWGVIKLESNVSSGIKPDKKFMSMFMGLVDGDGYIEIGPQKQYNKSNVEPKSTIRARLVIRLHNRDRDLLIYLTNVLGVGSISNLNSVNQTILIFSKKDLFTVIIPLINLYNLQFLTYNRICQYALLTYILENNFVHWEDVKFSPSIPVCSCNDLINLDFFADWIVGFTIAEGSFGLKANGTAFYQIKQKGIENYEIIKAICLSIAGRDAKPIKADSADSYQLTLSSRVDVQKVVNFFSSPNNYPLYGNKLKQYNLWLLKLKGSSRYAQIKSPNENNYND